MILFVKVFKHPVSDSIISPVIAVISEDAIHLCLPPIPILGSQVSLPFPMKWTDKAKGKLKDKGKELRNILRPHTPVPPSIHRTEHGADLRLLEPVPSIHKLEDEAEDSKNRFLAPNHAPTDDDFVAPSVLTPSHSITQDVDQLTPTIVMKESPTSWERLSRAPKYTFVRTANPQHDIAVLHVAFVLKDSPDLQELIVAVEKLNSKPSVR